MRRFASDLKGAGLQRRGNAPIVWELTAAVQSISPSLFRPPFDQFLWRSLPTSDIRRHKTSRGGGLELGLGTATK